ncbi:MAG: hypothetical protein KatS3mg118_2371 [Paracoccaceae bacterium]|nr:MAG: hypothetical protein KatS3mg118_2371 [Paracoccaceae bacterium]
MAPDHAHTAAIRIDAPAAFRLRLSVGPAAGRALGAGLHGSSPRRGRGRLARTFAARRRRGLRRDSPPPRSVADRLSRGLPRRAQSAHLDPADARPRGRDRRGCLPCRDDRLAARLDGCGALGAADRAARGRGAHIPRPDRGRLARAPADDAGRAARRGPGRPPDRPPPPGWRRVSCRPTSRSCPPTMPTTSPPSCGPIRRPARFWRRGGRAIPACRWVRISTCAATCRAIASCATAGRRAT